MTNASAIFANNFITVLLVKEDIGEGPHSMRASGGWKDGKDT
jgi:hypothetical protein